MSAIARVNCLMSQRSTASGRVPARLSVAIATALLCTSTVLSAAPAAYAHTYVLPRGVYLDNAPGRKLLHDYGSFQLWSVDGAHNAELQSIDVQSVAGTAATRMAGGIAFEAGEFDPLNHQRTPAPTGFGLAKGDSGVSIELLQFVGPIANSWREELDALGVQVLQFVPNNAYAVLADAGGRARLSDYAARSPVVRTASTLEPIYKLNRVLAEQAEAGLSGAREVNVSVVLARHPGNRASKAIIESKGRGAALSAWWTFGEFEAIKLRISETDVATLANLADVFAIENYVEPILLDEVQNQIVAGNLTADRTGPSAPGYLAYLTGLGFATDPAEYPIVYVVDDGVGNGTIVNGAGDSTLTTNRDGVTSRVLAVTGCTTDPAPTSLRGHGHINASIVGGFDNRTGFPFIDPNGYLRGQGVNPFARLGNAKIFQNSGGFSLTNCGGSQTVLVRNQQVAGARISTNSWGAPVNGDYTADAATYDLMTRDANDLTAGPQPLIFLFAAGNSGAGAATVGSPGTGKNVITIGASENQRQSDESGSWTDGCQTGPTGADNAMDVIDFSSRGPAEGSRTKPELIAPGTHIQGTASTALGYTGQTVCDQFRPGGQTVFAASSGTSHSTPAVAGLASLAYAYLQDNYAVAEPSAAMMKAYLMAHPLYLTGVSGNGNLPTNTQGYGMPTLGQLFAASTARVVRDQLPEDAFTATGQVRELFLQVDNPAAPVRLTMAYSDAPGATSADPKVNNLNLSVEAAGSIYLGNRFTGAFSSTGGNADANNNYEAVFLAAGTGGLLRVQVTAFNVAGDGIPGNADSSDQDFALVCSNCTFATSFALTANTSQVSSCGAAGAAFPIDVLAFGGFSDQVALSLSGQPNGLGHSFTPATAVAPFQSNLALTTTGVAAGTYPLTVSGVSGANTRTALVTLAHSDAAAVAPSLASPADAALDQPTQPTLSWAAVPAATEYVVELSTSANFASIVQTATVTATSYTVNPGLSGATQYFWRVRSRNNCGDGALSAVRRFTTVPVFCAAPGTAIPDNMAAGINSTITVAIARQIADLDVRFEARHPWIGDLAVSLSKTGSPTTARLLDRPGGTGGCQGDNPNLILDDEAAATAEASCTNANPGYPIGGRFRPDDALTAFDTAAFAGDWVLNVSDRAGADLGFLDRWCLEPTFADNPSFAIRNDSYAVAEDGALTSSNVLSNDFGSNLVATLGTSVTQGTLNLQANGSFSYTPTANYCGADSFTYSGTDGTQTGQATVSLNVQCVNDPPLAANDSYNGVEGTTLVVNAAAGLLQNDSDIDNANLTAVVLAAPSNGTLTLAANGSFTYVPDAFFCGNAGFTYRAFDGTTSSATASVSITLSCVNDPPLVANQTLRIHEGAVNGAVVGTIVATDPDTGDAVAGFSVVSGTGQAIFAVHPTTGQITVSNGTPLLVGASFSLNVEVRDTNNAVRSAVMTINVLGNAIFAHGFEATPVQ